LFLVLKFAAIVWPIGTALIFFGTEEIEAINLHYWARAICSSGAISPSFNLQGALNANQGTLADVVGSDLGGVAPDFEVKPIGLIAVLRAAIDRHGQGAKHAAGFVVFNVGIATYPTDEVNGVEIHGFSIFVRKTILMEKVDFD
jgi:hypothetical protein